MDKINQQANHNSEGSIVLWAVIGAAGGWLIAARLFLRGSDEFACVLASLGIMLVSALYASRKRRHLYPRIVIAILFGGVFVSFLTPQISQREPDRSKLIRRGFEPGGFSNVPWGLAGATLFLCVLLAFAPTSEAEAKSGTSES